MYAPTVRRSLEPVAPLMEITVYPAQFGIQPAKMVTPAGEVDVVRVQIQDAGPTLAGPGGPVRLPGPVVTVVFGKDDWEQFVRAVADPEGEAARAQARSKIMLAPNGMANRIRPKQ